ncbi:hypothetical protein [Actinoplanes aureus]|uniref:Uncharacterized protein n=1 Tax=Actinoplanes aureus TaxID=2792083 RepID=A0A931FXK9_9ACTN|nr:hypothetical protein [Actinoplanes aureus]MBG0562605.1 hypothetical protein [Actinoplanes aureus]
METIDSVLTAADRAWQAYGVRSADRAALAADLRADLEAAVAEGAGPDQLIGPDVGDFARRLADESGVPRSHPEYPRLLGTALVGAALGATAGYAVFALLYPLMIRMFDKPPAFDVPVQLTVGVFYGIPAAIVVLGAVITVRVRMREVARIRQTANAIAVLWPLTGLLITPVVMAFGYAFDYSLATTVVFSEIAIVLGALAGATYLARRWALREPRPRTTVPPENAASTSPA